MNLNHEFKSELKKLFNANKYETASLFERTARSVNGSGDIAPALRQHGRAPFLVCTAVTIVMGDGYEPSQIEWANEVLKLWTNRCPTRWKNCHFNIHPAILMDKTRFMREATYE